MPNQSSKTQLIPCRMKNFLVEFVDAQVAMKRAAGRKWSRSQEIEASVVARWLRAKEAAKAAENTKS